MKLLIADDEKAVCAIFSHHLRQYDSPYIEYRVVNDGKELLEETAEWKPDMIITDINMPNMTGLEAIEEIRNSGGDHGIRVFILSGYTDFDLVRQALKLGVADYIPKPVKYSQVEALLSKEEDMRFLGLERNVAYALGDEEAAIDLSRLIQNIAESWKAKDRESFESTLREFEEKNSERCVAISPVFFREKFEREASCLEEQLAILRSLSSEELMPKKNRDITSEMKSMVEKYYSDSSFGLDQVAFDLGYNTQYLSMLFKKETGENFSSYLTSWRISRAKEMLSSSDRKIKDVATDCGYNYTNYFIKVFNKAEGMSPADWRKLKG